MSMYQQPTKKLINRATALAIALSAVGLICAFFFGLGWFFLFGTIRRLVYFPFINRRVRAFLQDEGQPMAIQSGITNKNLSLWSTISSLIIFIGWLGLSIFAFAKVNDRLIDVIIKLFSNN